MPSLINLEKSLIQIRPYTSGLTRIQTVWHSVGIPGSRSFCQRGSRPDCQKTSLTTVFAVCFYVFYSGLTMVYFRENYNFQGFNFFQGGRVHLFPGGVPNANFYRNQYNVIFQWGLDPPIPSSGSAHGHCNKTNIINISRVKIKHSPTLTVLLKSCKVI